MLKLTGLWKGETKEGQTYFYGDLGPMLKVLIFPNKNKKSSAHPDFELFIERPAPKKTDGEQE